VNGEGEYSANAWLQVELDVISSALQAAVAEMHFQSGRQADAGLATRFASFGCIVFENSHAHTSRFYEFIASPFVRGRADKFQLWMYPKNENY
jgi:hypothetical protein